MERGGHNRRSTGAQHVDKSVCRNCSEFGDAVPDPFGTEAIACAVPAGSVGSVTGVELPGGGHGGDAVGSQERQTGGGQDGALEISGQS